MKGFCVLIGVVASLLDPYTAAEESVPSLESRMADFVEDAAVETGFTGAVLVAHEGKVVHAFAKGKLGGDSDATLNENTLFEIASITKSFTGVAVMILAERKQLDLDESIATYLPGIPEDCKTITVRHLLQNTSGIPGTNVNGSGSDITTVISSFLDGGPRHDPGTRYEYWNQGWALLSEIIASASGMSYVEFTGKAIFKPAGMTSSCFVGDPLPEGSSCATGMSSRGPDRLAITPPYAKNYGFEYRGMGGLVTNIRDLHNFDRALAEGKLLSPESIEEMTTVGRGSYALGWRIKNDPEGKPYQSHGGRSPGFTAHFSRYPGTGSCVIVLSNDDKGDGVRKIEQGCRQILFNLDPAPDAKDTKFFSSIEGKYRDEEGQSLFIKSAGPRAYMDVFWSEKIVSGQISRNLDGSLGWEQVKTNYKFRKSVEFETEAGKPVVCIFDTIRFVRDE